MDNTVPSLRKLKSDPALLEAYTQWRSSREAFNKALEARDPVVVAKKWQKHYFRGLYPDGSPSIAGHQTKIRPRTLAVEDDGES